MFGREKDLEKFHVRDPLLSNKTSIINVKQTQQHM